MTNQSNTPKTFSERLQATLDKQAVTEVKYDKKGSEVAYKANCGQCCDDPWKINHYR